MPSTSTGITASTSSLYRIYEQDSDEEIQQQQQPPPPPASPPTNPTAEQPLINILPTPLNGTHDMYINILQIPISSTNNRSNNVITVRNESVTNYDNNETTNNSYNRDSDSDSAAEIDGPSTSVTPNGKYNNLGTYTPDSGISSRPCSTSGSNTSMPCSSGLNNRLRHLEDNSDDPDWRLETFKKRLKRARLNLRNNINHGDSDSN